MSTDAVLEPVAVNVGEGAALLGLSRATFYKLVMSNSVPSFCVGTRRLIPVAALRAWAAEQVSIGGAA